MTEERMSEHNFYVHQTISRGDALTNIGLSVNCDLVEVFLLK